MIADGIASKGCMKPIQPGGTRGNQDERMVHRLTTGFCVRKILRTNCRNHIACPFVIR